MSRNLASLSKQSLPLTFKFDKDELEKKHRTSSSKMFFLKPKLFVVKNSESVSHFQLELQYGVVNRLAGGLEDIADHTRGAVGIVKETIILEVEQLRA